MPPACPLPAIRLNLKTRVARLRLNKKSFAPKEFTGYVGSGRKPLHRTHRLAAARGVVWCWKCGQTATFKPRGLTKPCRAPTDWGLATLKRLRKGKPPYNLDDWPDDDGAVYRQLVVAQTDDVWGTSTLGPPPRAPGSARE